jgi:Fur family ferric uptake transcriptional regulator
MSLYEEVLERVQARGERITIQRRLVIEILCKHPDHLSIADITRALQPPNEMPETTIYRILQWLKALEIVAQTDMGTDGIVYQLLVKPHHHLICLSCGNVSELDDRYLIPLREKLSADLGFKARIDHMAIYGICQTCGAARKAENR